MARFQYADSLADFPVNSAGKPLTNLDINVWTSKTGGALVTDLLDASGTPSTVARSDDFAGIAFSGPDGYSGTLWLEGLGGVRRRVSPVGTPERLTTIETGLATEIADRQTAVDDAIGQADDAAAARIASLRAEDDPFPQYVEFMTTDSSQKGSRNWVADSFPTAAQGAQDFDTLDYYGA